MTLLIFFSCSASCYSKWLKGSTPKRHRATNKSPHIRRRSWPQEPTSTNKLPLVLPPPQIQQHYLLLLPFLLLLAASPCPPLGHRRRHLLPHLPSRSAQLLRRRQDRHLLRRGSSVEVYYKDVSLCDNVWPQFYQPSNNVTVFKTALKGSSIELTSSMHKDLVAAQTSGKTVP